MSNGRTAEPRFLLLGHWGSCNRGCEAIVRTTTAMLSTQFPSASFTVASSNPETDGALWDIPNLEIIPAASRVPAIPVPPPVEAKRSVLRRVVRAFVPYGVLAARRTYLESRQTSRPARSSAIVDPHKMAHLRPAIESADAVLFVGGDNYTEDYGPPLQHMDMLDYAQSLGRKTVIWAASIGPFPTESVRLRMTRLLGATDLITARDAASVDYLADLGITENVRQVADPAFILEPRESERATLPETWAGKPVIGFNGSGLLFRYTDPTQWERLMGELTGFCRYLVDDLGFRLVLVPHDSLAGSATSDWRFLAELRQLIDRDRDLYLLHPALDARETKAMIGRCDLFVGMKMHATVAALSQGIPTLGLSYSQKTSELFSQMYGDARYVLPYGDLTQGALTDALGALMNHAAELRPRLAQRSADLRMQALTGAAFLSELMSGAELGSRANR